MGIPSYYRSLSQKVKGLISHAKPDQVDALYFDFNCLIYYVARKPESTLPVYPGDEGKETWENTLLDEVVRYVVSIWNETGKAKEVFLALDGVVPMAKIKQQRLRRFKSVWLAEEEKKSGIRDNKPSWDTNCITPGTAFMKRLGNRLEILCSQRPGWKVSTTSEPGEGEHKIMHILRSRTATKGSLLIYGLDADLILLTMLNAGQPAYLVREDSEMGGKEEIFSYFSIPVLQRSLWNTETPEYAVRLNYIAAMSLLGNDFLPHSLSVKIKENGHVKLLQSLQSKQILESDSQGQWRVQKQGLLELLRGWASQEENWMQVSFQKKLRMRGRIESTLETIPIDESVESIVFATGGSFVPHWRDIYRQQWLGCSTQEDIDTQCREYLIGFQWILDYYTGQRDIPMQWYYTRLLPPLWSDIVSFLEKNPFPTTDVSLARAHLPIQPHEQLAMVLPMESWGLIEDKRFRALPVEIPQYWPSKFRLFTVGRTRTWECEPLLPIVSIDTIRKCNQKK